MAKRPSLRNPPAAVLIQPVAPVRNAEEEYAETYNILANSRMLAEKIVPTFISPLRVCNIVITEAIPTAGIDKYWRVYWNPDLVDFLVRAANSISVANPCEVCGETSHHQYAYVAGVWIHEAGHQVFKHGQRFEDLGILDAHKWNVCADAEMNDDIPAIGKQAAKDALAARGVLPAMCLPKSILIDPVLDHKASTSKEFWAARIPYSEAEATARGLEKTKFLIFPDTLELPEGLIAENYYVQWVKPPEEGEGDGEGGEGEGEGGEGEGDGDPKDCGGDHSKFKKKIFKNQKVKSVPCKCGHGDAGSHGDPFPGAGDPNDPANHGSGVDGEDRSWEDGEPSDANPSPGIQASEGSAVRRDVAIAIKKQKQEGRGHIPGGWDVFADAQLQVPKVRWQEQLKNLARQSLNRIRGERSNTYRRLSRSSIVNNCAVIKPSTYDSVPTVMIILDTSGSMGAGRRSRLESAMSEAEAILKLGKVKAYFIDCDANVYGTAQEVRSLRSARISGGGGTDMRVGVKASRSQKGIKPDMIVLITDGDTPWPDAVDVQGVTVFTAIVHESGTNGCPKYMNPIWVDTTS